MDLRHQFWVCGPSRLAAAHQERPEGQGLAEFYLPLPHQFKARGEGRRHRGGALLRRREIFGEIGVERHPVHVVADQPIEDFARFLQRPDIALERRVVVGNAALALRGVGLEQIEQRGFPQRRLAMVIGSGAPRAKIADPAAAGSSTASRPGASPRAASAGTAAAPPSSRRSARRRDAACGTISRLLR